MDRFNFLIYSLLIYILGVVFSQKTMTAILWFLNKLRKPVEFIKSWGDVVFALVAFVILGHFTYIWWPLTNDESQVLIFSITTLTLFYQAVIGDGPDKFRNRPKISVVFDIKETDNYHVTIMENNWKTNSGKVIRGFIDTYYIRLRVENTGNTTLKNTQVVLRRVLDGELKRPFFPLNLYWEFGGEKVDIPPKGASKAINIFEVMNPSQTYSLLAEYDLDGGGPDRERYKEQGVGFRACSTRPNTLSDVFSAGNYIFQLMISADNAEPKNVNLEINYNKDWSEDVGIEEMRSKYLQVSLVG